MRAVLDGILKEATKRAASRARRGGRDAGWHRLRGRGRPARLDGDTPMTTDTIFAIASMTKAITSVATMQLVEEGTLALDQEAREIVPEIGALQCSTGSGPTVRRSCGPRAPGDFAPSPDAHVRLRLRLPEPRSAAVSGMERPAGGAHRQARRVRGADAVRSRRRLGVRHRHRLGRPDAGGGQRRTAGPLSARPRDRPARDARHRFHAFGRTTRPQGGDAPARPGRRLTARCRSCRSRNWSFTRVAAGSTRRLPTTSAFCGCCSAAARWTACGCCVPRPSRIWAATRSASCPCARFPPFPP